MAPSLSLCASCWQRVLCILPSSWYRVKIHPDWTHRSKTEKCSWANLCKLLKQFTGILGDLVCIAVLATGFASYLKTGASLQLQAGDGRHITFGGRCASWYMPSNTIGLLVRSEFHFKPVFFFFSPSTVDWLETILFSHSRDAEKLFFLFLFF